MSKIDMNKLAEVIANKDVKAIEKDHHQIRILFYQTCIKNKKYSKLYNLYRELQDLMYKNSLDFDEKTLSTVKQWAENWEVIKAKEEQKIQNLKHAILFKQSRMQKAEENLAYMQQQVDKYNKYIANEQKKEEIIRIYGNEETLNHILKDARRKMAMQILEDHIMEYPNVIGKIYTHNSDEISNNLYPLQYEVEEACNIVRQQVKNYINKTTTQAEVNTAESEMVK